MPCPEPEGIANGVILPNTNNTQGGRVYYSCNTGFTMSGSASQICVSGTWVGTAPTCSQTTYNTDLDVSGLDVPLWLLILFVVLIAALILALFLFLICYCCCRDLQCCKRRGTRRTSDWNSRYHDDHYHDGGYPSRSNRYPGFVDDPIWFTSERNHGRFRSTSPRSDRGARLIHVQPGRRVLLLDDDSIREKHTQGTNTESGTNKANARIRDKPKAATIQKDDNNYGQTNNADPMDNGYIVIPSQPPTATSENSNRSSNRFKTKSTAVKNSQMWMPHSNSVRTDASHVKTTTR